MKKNLLLLLSLILALALLALAIPALANNALISFVNVSDGDEIFLDIGETIDFQVQVNSSVPFIHAIMLSDQYYPGRGIFMGGADIVTQASSADLSLSATGKNSTANLAATDTSPGGCAPVGLVVGVRYLGGVVETERIDFCIYVDVE